ncbi:MAG: hypothetical protein J6X56_03625 [Ruminococcus sp.]|nr:hypothetical protein [Ruminococcus sp.]
MRKKVITAAAGALIAASLVTACSDHNTDYRSEPEEVTTTEAVTTAETVITTAEPSTKPEKVIPGDLGKPSEEAAMNRPQFVYIMDDGSYVYVSGKNGQNGKEDVYIRDDRKGHTEELSLPAKSMMLYTDGKTLYYYVPGEGVCEYRDGKSKNLSRETAVSENSSREREDFYFTDDSIYFTCPSDSGTVIKSMDYSGKLSDKEYNVEYNNVRIVGTAEVSGKTSLICTYHRSINDFIRIIGDNGVFTDISSGGSPYIVGDRLYYIKDQRLCRNDLSGMAEEILSDKGCKSYCFFGDRLYYANTEAVCAMDRDGRTEKILSAGDLDGTGYIEGVCTVSGRLFVSGGAGAFTHSLAEIDENGKVTEKIHSDK